MQEIIQKFEDEYNATQWFLVFSAIWSFKTCALTAIKIKAETKNFLPFLSKLTLTIRYLFIFGIRVGAIVSYFSPFLGLLGIMNHYHAETIPLAPETWMKLEKSGYSHWNPTKQEYESIHISDLFRSDYTKPIPKSPPKTLYTLIRYPSINYIGS